MPLNLSFRTKPGQTAPELPSFPSGWDEVTLGQFLRIVKDGNTPRALLTILADRAELLHILSENNLNAIIASLTFINEVPDLAELPMPTSILIKGKPIKIPKDLGSQTTIGQRWEIEEYLETVGVKGDEGVAPMESIVPLLSIILCPLITGKPFTDIVQARAIEADIEAMPCLDALPIGAFFLKKLRQPPESGDTSLEISRPRPKSNFLLRIGFRS